MLCSQHATGLDAMGGLAGASLRRLLERTTRVGHDITSCVPLVGILPRLVTRRDSLLFLDLFLFSGTPRRAVIDTSGFHIDLSAVTHRQTGMDLFVLNLVHKQNRLVELSPAGTCCGTVAALWVTGTAAPNASRRLSVMHRRQTERAQCATYTVVQNIFATITASFLLPNLSRLTPSRST